MNEVLQSRVEEFKQSCTAFQDQIAGLERLLESAQTSLSSSKEEYANLKSQFDMQTIHAVDMSKQIDKLQEELEKKEIEIEWFRNQVSTLSTEVQEAQTLHDQEGTTQNDDSAQLNAEIEYLQKKTVDLLAQITKKESELERLRTYLVEQEETSTQETLQMQQTIQEFKMQIQQLENERDEWGEIKKQEDRERVDAGLQAESHREMVASLLEEKASLQSKSDSDSLIIRNLQNVLAQFESCTFLLCADGD